MGKRDRSQLKFLILLYLAENGLGVSKYRLKKDLNIPTSKQLNKLIEDLLSYNFIRQEQVYVHKEEGGVTNLFYLTEKGQDFISRAEKLLLDFFNLSPDYLDDSVNR
ncbi:MAG: hypothetical protein D6732_10285 [Methanobacteriota archaeon]|nr:MAG: hypothetical protein D6732_10285 [Euryarchaeota archaeon]